MNPSNAYTFLLLLSCSVAFFYWEGGALLQDLRQERELERLEDEYLKEKEGKGSEADKNEGAVSAEEKASRERKRALGWLAMVTWLALWCTGAVNKLNPFMP